MPGRDFTFGQFIAAQAGGDATVLADHGRPVLRLHLTRARQPGSRRSAQRSAGAAGEPGARRRGRQPAARPPRQAPPPHRRAVLAGALRGHRRPRPQEADAGDLRPREPWPAAAGLLADRVRPARLGRPGLRQDRLRVGARAGPHAVPRGGLAHARRGHPLRAGQLRRRRLLRPARPGGRRARRAARHRGQPRLLPVDPTVVVRHGLPAARALRALDPRRRGRGGGSSSRSRSATT